jgi:plasmid maintenance system antidote protein VapI
MTLIELFATRQITKPRHLARVLDLDRRYAWKLWHGERRLGAKLALRLHERTGIPIQDLLRAERAIPRRRPGPPPKARPRRQKL